LQVADLGAYVREDLDLQNNIRLWILPALFLLALVCQAASDRGAIQGTVNDPQGAVIGGVKCHDRKNVDQCDHQHHHERCRILLMESRSTNHWLGIHTVGTKSNLDGTGARVEVQAGKLKLVDEVCSGGSYLYKMNCAFILDWGRLRRLRI
jgi:hypothetical protein